MAGKHRKPPLFSSVQLTDWRGAELAKKEAAFPWSQMGSAPSMRFELGSRAAAGVAILSAYLCSTVLVV